MKEQSTIEGLVVSFAVETNSTIQISAESESRNLINDHGVLQLLRSHQNPTPTRPEIVQQTKHAIVLKFKSHE